MTITYTFSCPDASELTYTGSALVCQGGAQPVPVPMLMGLADLSWADVGTLVGALLISCSLAAAYNALFSTLNRK